MVSELEKIKEREALVELMRLYKSFSSLWDRTHKNFHNPLERQKAHEIILEKYKKFDETANIGDIQRKLWALRSAIKKEKLKMQSIILGVGHCENYEPGPWYYPYLSFLYPFEGEQRAPSPDYFYYTRVRQEMEAEMKRNGKFPEESSSFQRDSAELAAYSAEAYGQALSYQLKALTKLQRCVAEKLIQDILLLAKTEKLTTGTVLYLEYKY